MKTLPGPVAVEAGAIHVEGDKVRIETPDLADGFFLLDRAKPSAYYVRPSRKVFMEARQTNILTRVLVPLGSSDPCQTWQAMAVVAGTAKAQMPLDCTRVGEERIGDRSMTLYRAATASHQTMSMWVDPQLDFPVRVLTGDGTRFDVFDVRRGAQMGSLFDLPQDFGKFDPQGLINRIKQSDVWVEPRK